MTEPNESSENPFDRLDATAKVVTSALTHNNCHHGFIGGYAVSLVGGERITDARLLSIFSTLDTSPRLI